MSQNNTFNWLSSKIILAIGDIYEGVYKDGKLNGQDKMIFVNGAIYKGEFKDNELNGQDKIIYVNGDIFGRWFKVGDINGQFYIPDIILMISYTIISYLINMYLNDIIDLNFGYLCVHK